MRLYQPRQQCDPISFDSFAASTATRLNQLRQFCGLDSDAAESASTHPHGEPLPPSAASALIESGASSRVGRGFELSPDRLPSE